MCFCHKMPPRCFPHTLVNCALKNSQERQQSLPAGDVFKQTFSFQVQSPRCHRDDIRCLKKNDGWKVSPKMSRCHRWKKIFAHVDRDLLRWPLVAAGFHSRGCSLVRSVDKPTGWCWLEHGWIIFHINGEWNNHPNLLITIFQRSRYTTNQIMYYPPHLINLT